MILVLNAKANNDITKSETFPFVWMQKLCC